MNRQALSIRGGLPLTLALGLLAGVCATAPAQGFRGGGGGGGFPSPEESFNRLDTNQNGQIDPSEIQQLDGFRKQFMTGMGIDGSRVVSRQEYLDSSQKMREQMEQRFRSGGGGGPPGGFGGGGPPSSRSSDSERRDESSGRDGRREDRDDRRRDDRDASQERGGRESSTSKSASKKTAKPKTRVTHELPADYRDKDKNGDGQIGLYEWDRKAFAQFYALDRNGDGLLTPDELIAATKKNSSSDKSSSKSGSTSSTASSSGDSATTSSTEAVKSSDSLSTKSATTTKTEISAAEKSFLSLDRNNDGKLTDDEWQRARTSREKFKKAGIEITLPLQQAQFVELYNKANTQ